MQRGGINTFIWGTGSQMSLCQEPELYLCPPPQHPPSSCHPRENPGLFLQVGWSQEPWMSPGCPLGTGTGLCLCSDPGEGTNRTVAAVPGPVFRKKQGILSALSVEMPLGLERGTGTGQRSQPRGQSQSCSLQLQIRALPAPREHGHASSLTSSGGWECQGPQGKLLQGHGRSQPGSQNGGAGAAHPELHPAATREEFPALMDPRAENSRAEGFPELRIPKLTIPVLTNPQS